MRERQDDAFVDRLRAASAARPGARVAERLFADEPVRPIVRPWLWGAAAAALVLAVCMPASRSRLPSVEIDGHLWRAPADRPALAAWTARLDVETVQR